MQDCIIKNENGVVGKYRTENKPNVPDNLTVEGVDDVRGHSVDDWFDK